MHKEKYALSKDELIAKLVEAVKLGQMAALGERMRLMTVAYDLTDDAAERAMIARKAAWLDVLGQLDAALAAYEAAKKHNTDEGEKP